jgi:Tol biopolymer transport system component
MLQRVRAIAYPTILFAFTFTSLIGQSATVHKTSDLVATLERPRVSPLVQHKTPDGVSVGPKIVFGSARNNGNHDVFVMDADGSNQTQLTTSLAYDDQPKWSPDGSKIVFMSGRDGNLEIYSMNANGTGQTRLTTNAVSDGFPSWSPDGTRIAFVSGNLNDPNTFEIFVMNADGTNRTQLTSDSLVDAVPSWSPDSAKIIFMSGPSIFDPNNFEIFTISSNGTNRTRLTTNSLADGQASYSPNGTKILFASGDVMNPGGIEIFVMNADGTNRTQLTSNSVTDGFPAWSPDGTQIVFASGNIADETTVELFVMNANGTNQTRLTNNSVIDWFPNYQPSGITATIQLSAASFSVSESAGKFTIGVTRTDNTNTVSSVSYATSDTAGQSACSGINGQASFKCDYLKTLGTLTFAIGEASKTISIPISDDSFAEGSENFSIVLSNPVSAILGAQSTAVLTITDNETVNGTNPLDSPGFFVRQHYIDFLNREPDTNGFNFWVNEITLCGANIQCVEVKRVNVSAAFFLAIEFQETGYLVYRIYKSAFGNLTGAPVPVAFNEFLRDTQQLQQGFQVNVGNWQAQLEANKQAYTLAFVQRAEFLAAFPNSMSATQFVTQLDTRAGSVLSPAEQANLINLLGGTPADVSKRSQVLRAVAEDTDLKSAEFNKAFVLMEYFGYLRRNPNDAPEPGLNFDGYNFWLGKLNQFNGNFVAAEMVKAFIASDEYRLRFGP